MSQTPRAWLESVVLMQSRCEYLRAPIDKKPLIPRLSRSLELERGEGPGMLEFVLEAELLILQDRRPTKRDPSPFFEIAIIETTQTGAFALLDMEFTEDIANDPPTDITVPLILAHREVLADMTRWMGLPEFPRHDGAFLGVGEMTSSAPEAPGTGG